MNTPICKCCEQEINENYGIYYTLQDEPYCESCESQAWSYANTVVVCENGENKKYLWCSEFGFRDTEYWEDTDPDGVESFKYIKTDGWRGYWDPVIAPGYVTLASGWSTGRWEDVAYKHKFNDLVESIHEGEIECPFKIVFAFGLTSNVFSVASDVVILESELERFTQWLAMEAGLTVEELSQSLR